MSLSKVFGYYKLLGNVRGHTKINRPSHHLNRVVHKRNINKNNHRYGRMTVPSTSPRHTVDFVLSKQWYSTECRSDLSHPSWYDRWINPYPYPYLYDPWIHPWIDPPPFCPWIPYPYPYDSWIRPGVYLNERGENILDSADETPELKRRVEH